MSVTQIRIKYVHLDGKDIFAHYGLVVPVKGQTVRFIDMPEFDERYLVSRVEWSVGVSGKEKKPFQTAHVFVR